MLKAVQAGVLEVGYFEYGPPDGWAVVLSHGFPYDVHAYDEAAALLADRGARVIIPDSRGFGSTRFRSPTIDQTCQQTAPSSDLIALLDALHIDQAILAGYDWAGLPSCAATILWPERVTGLVSLASYGVLDIRAG